MAENIPVNVAEKPETNNLAIISMVLSIIGFVGFCICLGPLLGIPAVICGHIALSKIKSSGGKLSGRGMAIAGLIIGYLTILLTVIWILFSLIAIPKFVSAAKEAKQVMCISRIRQIGTACQVYKMEYMVYPDRLSRLYPEYISDLETFTCPNTYNYISSAEDIDEHSGYVYNCDCAPEDNGKTPLVCDREGNHPDGVNCYFSDGEAEWCPNCGSN
ncbi:MAG: DUF4190 domain-containing protein [Candidatus Aureabacteria bacterium]|nr:DUF4190 domain-containing protein [Candidatus Auribacterota bacterium]